MFDDQHLRNFYYAEMGKFQEAAIYQVGYVLGETGIQIWVRTFEEVLNPKPVMMTRVDSETGEMIIEFIEQEK